MEECHLADPAAAIRSPASSPRAMAFCLAGRISPVNIFPTLKDGGVSLAALFIFVVSKYLVMITI